jgi:hypothetical protein
LIEFVLEA